MPKFRLKNTPNHGDIIIEFYVPCENQLRFLQEIFGINCKPDYIFDGKINDCQLYRHMIKKIIKDNKITLTNVKIYYS